MGRLSDKVAWIIGGGSGIGEAGARTLAAAGALVILPGQEQQKLDRGPSPFNEVGGKAEAVALDVANPEGVQQAADGILRCCGHVDILVASAGSNIERRFWKDAHPKGGSRWLMLT